MKKIILLSFILPIAFSCKDIEKFNEAPKLATDVPAGALFANATKALSDNLASTNVNINIFRMLAQQWTETTYTDESNYDLGTRTIPDNWWHRFYRDIIQDFEESKRLIDLDDDPTQTDENKRNQKAMAEVLQIYAMSNLVLTFGDVPYSEALDINNFQPKYDEAATIYADLLARLTNAINDLDGSVGSKFPTYDLLYGGDVPSWKTFAASLKIRLGIILADVDPTAAQAAVESAYNIGPITNNGGNAKFTYLTGTPNTNPLWVSLVQSGRKDFVAANTLVDTMTSLDDPRTVNYFTVDPNNGYTGGIYGSSNSYVTYSKPGAFATTPETPNLLMDATETLFSLAEAAERGYSVGNTAASYYAQAITASMEYWGVNSNDITTYLARPDVDYATAVAATSGGWKEVIGTQKWIALYNNGWEAWTEWRRLDYPVLEAPEDAISAIPLRFTYPVSEQNLNTNSYDDVISKIGDDVVDNKLFWDIN